MLRIEETNRTIYDDYIVKVNTFCGALNVVQTFREMGYTFNGNPQKTNCYYIARRVVMDEGYHQDGKTEFKLTNWGRNEICESNEFHKVQTYKEFMGEDEPIDKIKTFNLEIGGITFISSNEKDIFSEIRSQMNQLEKDDELEFKISYKMMTEEEYSNLPEFDGF